jgi:hypothetical protein
MATQKKTQEDFIVELDEIDRRMAKIKADLQPHFDRSKLSQKQQADFYAHMRDQIPITMEQETRGVSKAQLLNAQQKRLQQKPNLTASNRDVIDKAIESVFKNPSLEIRKFVSDNFHALLLSEQEGFKQVIAHYHDKTCIGCHKDEAVFFDIAPLLASIRAGNYPLAHIWRNEYDDEYWCTGPRLSVSNGIDPAQFDKFMAGVKEKMDFYQKSG